MSNRYKLHSKVFNSGNSLLCELRKKDPYHKALVADLLGDSTSTGIAWGASLMVSINNFDTIESSIGLHPLMFSIIKDAYMLGDLEFLNKLVKTVDGVPFILTQDMEEEYGELSDCDSLEKMRLVYITIKIFENYELVVKSSESGYTTKLISNLVYDMDVMRKYIDDNSLNNEETQTFKLSNNSVEIHELRCLLVYNGLASHEPKFHVNANHPSIYEYIGKEDDATIHELELFGYYVSVLLHSNVESTSVDKLNIINNIISTLGYTRQVEKIDNTNGILLDLKDGVKLKLEDGGLDLSKRMQCIYVMALSNNVNTPNKFLRLLVKFRYTIIHSIIKKEINVAVV